MIAPLAADAGVESLWRTAAARTNHATLSRFSRTKLTPCSSRDVIAGVRAGADLSTRLAYRDAST